MSEKVTPPSTRADEEHDDRIMSFIRLTLRSALGSAGEGKDNSCAWERGRASGMFHAIRDPKRASKASMLCSRVAQMTLRKEKAYKRKRTPSLPARERSWRRGHIMSVAIKVNPLHGWWE